MFFTIKNKKYLSTEQLRTSTLLKAFYIIQKYPLHATEQALDKFIQEQYGTTLKNMCVKLLLGLTLHEDTSGNLVFMFNNPEYDKIARIITYGTGALLGSPIIKAALKN